MSSASTSARPTSILTEGQSDEDFTIKFKNIRDLLEVINKTTNDIVIATNISPSQFKDLVEERDRQGRKFRFNLYDPQTNVLVITIPHAPHETIHLELNQRLIMMAGLRGAHALRNRGAITLPVGHSGGGAGEGDSSSGPTPERTTPDGWPTLVIEAGYSQTLSRMRVKMHWWFSTSNHDVKMVILAKLNVASRTLTIEKWIEEASLPRPGATTTRRAAALVPVLNQTVTISQVPGSQPPAFDVTSGALVLEYRLLYLRDPQDGQGDFVFSVEELQDYAAMVWAAVEW